MSFCHRLEVIGLVGMREHAVDQSGIHRRGHDVGGQDDRFRGAALRACITDRHLRVSDALPTPSPPACPECDAWLPAPRAARDLLACLRHVARQLAGDIRLGHSISFLHLERSTATPHRRGCVGGSPPTAEVGQEHVGYAFFVAVGKAGTVWRHDNVGQIPQRRVFGQRLLREHVQVSAGKSAGAQRVNQRRSSTTSPREMLTTAVSR